MTYGQRTPEYRIHDAEDGGICADAEREGEHGHAVKPAFLRSRRNPARTS